MAEDPAVAAPVFVCGLGRSGTTWISTALGQSPELTYIQEAWLVERLAELANWFAMLHDDWTGFTPWNRRGVDRRTFVDGMARWYRELLTLAAGGRRFIEKTPHWNALHLEFLHELFPDAYFVLIHRDGRNCVASLEAKKAKQGEPFDFAAACRQWAAAMDVFSHVRASGTIENVTLIRYEDLLHDFDAVFAELCAFTRIRPFRAEPHPPNTAFATEPSAGDFACRWSSWPPHKRRTFKRLAGGQLSAWGYAPSNDSW